MSERRRSLLAYSAAMLGCGVLLTVLLQLWRADFRVPFSYGGDAVCAQLWAKGVAENGWFLENPALGAPGRMEMHDFPLADGLFFLLLRGAALVSGDHVVALNAYYLATFFLATASALFSLRRLGVARGPAVVCGLLYAFLHYHFFRGEAHLFLASYFLVPLAAMVCVWLYRDGELLFRERDGRVRLDLGSGRAIGALATCAVLGSGGIYYAAFTCYLLLVAGCCAAASRRRVHPLGSAAILVGLIVAGGIVNLAPTLLYRLRHGPNPSAVVRFPIHAELLGLADDAAPAARAGASDRGSLAGLRRGYDLAQTVPAWDSDAASLGLVGAIGFLGLPSWASLGAESGRARPGWSLMRLAAAELLAAILLATTERSLGAIASYVRQLRLIRCYNRISVFLAFFALAAMAPGFATKPFFPRRQDKPMGSAHLELPAVLVGPSFASRGDAPVAEAERRPTRDAAFVRQIEQTLPAGERDRYANSPAQCPYPQSPMGHRMR